MPTPAGHNPSEEGRSFRARVLRNLRPSHQHTELSATVLLMVAVMLSRVIGYLREAYIAWAFGAGLNTDAYVGAFNLPDFLNYILAGGTASITFISIYTRYTSSGRKKEAQDAFNSTITIMTAVVCLGTVLLEIFTPQIERLIFPHFSPEQLQLCVHLTRILLPGQIFFYAGGIVSAVLYSRRMFLYPALSPILYNVFIILGGLVGARRFGIESLAYGALVGAIVGPFLINAIGAARDGLSYRLNFDFGNREFREWVRLSIPLMLGVSLVSPTTGSCATSLPAAWATSLIESLAYGALVGAIVGPFLINAIGAARDGLSYRLNFDFSNREFREWVRLSIPLMLGVLAGFGRRLDTALLCLRRRGRHHATQLRQAAVRRAHLDSGTSRGPGLHAVLRAALRRRQAAGVRRYCQPIRVPDFGGIASCDSVDDAGSLAAHRPRLSPRALYLSGFAGDRSLLFLVCALAGAVVGAGTLLPRLLCRG